MSSQNNHTWIMFILTAFILDFQSLRFVRTKSENWYFLFIPGGVVVGRLGSLPPRNQSWLSRPCPLIWTPQSPSQRGWKSSSRLRTCRAICRPNHLYRRNAPNHPVPSSSFGESLVLLMFFLTNFCINYNISADFWNILQ